MITDHGGAWASESESTTETYDQLWKTWCNNGLELPGHVVRAASPNLRDVRGPRYARLTPHLYYGPPKGVSITELQPSNAPIGLTFLDFGNERVLVRTRFTNHGRPGNYFVHVLAGLPSTYSARQAIAAWDWIGWRESDGELAPHSTNLEPVPRESLRKATGWADEPWTELEARCLAFAIEAYLALEPHQRLYFAAPSALVARLIDGLLRALPYRMVATVTFATYLTDLNDHLRATPRIIGTWWPPEYSRRLDLGDHHYRGWGLATNTFTGRFSTLPECREAIAYSDFAVGCLAGGQPERLAEFLKRADQAEVANTRALLLLAAAWVSRASLPTFLPGSAPPTVDPDVQALLQSGLAAAVLDQSDLNSQIRKLILADETVWPSWAEQAIRDLAASVPASPFPHLAATLATLADDALGNAVQALAANQVDRARRMLALAVTCDPTRSRALGTRLVQESVPYAEEKENTKPTVEAVYEWVLEVASHTEGIEVKDIEHWLAVQDPHVPWLLTREIPHAWRIQVVQSSILDGWSAGTLRQVATTHPLVLQDALLALLPNEGASRSILACIRSLLQRPAHPSALNLADALLARMDPAAPFLSQFVRLLDHDLEPEDLRSLFSRRPLAFLRSAQREESLWTLVRWYLNNLTTETILAPNTTSVLQLLANEKGVPHTISGLARQLGAVVASLEGMDSPHWSSGPLFRALQDPISRIFRLGLLPAVGRALGPRVTSYEELQTTVDRLSRCAGLGEVDQVFWALLSGACGEAFPRADTIAAFIEWASLQPRRDHFFEDIERSLAHCDLGLLDQLQSRHAHWSGYSLRWWRLYYQRWRLDPTKPPSRRLHTQP